jgi:uncharacterized protein (UPF0218 family)
MPATYTVTPEILKKFKDPFGTLVKGNYSETAKQLQTIIQKQKPVCVISVGDTVSRNLHEQNIIPQLSITDNKSQRKQLPHRLFQAKKLIQVKNPEGTITEEAIKAIQTTLETSEHTHILVEGEEDLLTLIVVVYAPENSLVVYGQPNEGLVVLTVTKEKRAEAQQIWKAMKKTQTT